MLQMQKYFNLKVLKFGELSKMIAWTIIVFYKHAVARQPIWTYFIKRFWSGFM